MPSEKPPLPASGAFTEELSSREHDDRRFVPTPTLEWHDGDKTLRHVVRGRTLVGSGDTADLVLRDGAMSRLHAELEPAEDGLWVRDLSSRNGTFVGTYRVDRVCLTDGARVRLGRTQITVRYSPGDAHAVDAWPTAAYRGMIGSSRAMREMFARLDRIARADASALVQGETGTGKELVARSIHDSSNRAKGPFVIVDCGSLSETLLESELFGHTKGAFTGALASRAGAIEAAHGGTLFLDEIGELPLAMQPKLLRALESRQVRRLGETAYRPVDVRFVAATHRDLLAMVGKGEFREDLYFRVSVLLVRVPALRERAEDIAALASSFAGETALHEHVLREIETRPWPGNVRELRNFVERARALGSDEALLGLSGRRTSHGAPSSPAGGPGESAPAAIDALEGEGFDAFRERWIALGERRYFEDLLARHSRNVRRVAEVAGVNKSYVYKLIQKHGL